MNSQSKYSGLKSLGLVLLLGALVFGGIGITGAAAQAAIPGDTLYSVKSTIERAQLSFAQDAGDRAELRLAFAEKRLQEIEALIAEGRYPEVGEAALAFEADLNGAIIEMGTISRLDPARGSQIALEITSALMRFSQSLSEMAGSAPESVRTDVERALDTTEIADSLDLSSVGLLGDDSTDDNSNVNGDDNSNVNGDDDSNVNGDDDCSFNGNDSASTNGNDDCAADGDDDSNTNGDDDSNTNGDDSNSNGDDDSNTNGDDSGGGSDDSGSGSDDSGSGSDDD